MIICNCVASFPGEYSRFLIIIIVGNWMEIAEMQSFTLCVGDENTISSGISILTMKHYKAWGREIVLNTNVTL